MDAARRREGGAVKQSTLCPVTCHPAQEDIRTARTKEGPRTEDGIEGRITSLFAGHGCLRDAKVVVADRFPDVLPADLDSALIGLDTSNKPQVPTDAALTSHTGVFEMGAGVVWVVQAVDERGLIAPEARYIVQENGASSGTKEGKRQRFRT